MGKFFVFKIRLHFSHPQDNVRIDFIRRKFFRIEETLIRENWEKKYLIRTTTSNGFPTSIDFTFASRISKTTTWTSYSTNILSNTIGFTTCWIPWTSTSTSWNGIYSNTYRFTYIEIFLIVFNIPNIIPETNTSTTRKMRTRAIRKYFSMISK